MSNRSSIVLTSLGNGGIFIAADTVDALSLSPVNSLNSVKSGNEPELKIEQLPSDDTVETGRINPDFVDVQCLSDEERFLAEQFYVPSILDYNELFYGQTKEKSAFEAKEGEYFAEAPNVETGQEMLTTEEAEETFVKIQYSAMLGTASDVSAEERRKFDWWIKFNPSYFAVFLANSLTCDVNYGSL